MNQAAIDHLSSVDPVLKRLMAEAGPCGLKPDPKRSPFQALVQAVAHQQLNGKAANTILGRFVALFPRGRFPSAAAVLAMPADKLTGVGFSRAKASYIHHIARAAINGLVPGRRAIEKLGDDEIIERLTQVKGVGRWSVEMFLMFGLGRPDVLPVHDFGVRRGFSIAYRKRELPTPARLEAFGERWRPHRSTAAWYLWRAIELAERRGV